MGGPHPQAGGKLGLAKMEVCGAAAEVRFEAQEVRFGAVGGPRFEVQAALDLVGPSLYWCAHISSIRAPGSASRQAFLGGRLGLRHRELPAIVRVRT